MSETYIFALNTVHTPVNFNCVWHRAGNTLGMNIQYLPRSKHYFNNTQSVPHSKHSPSLL